MKGLIGQKIEMTQLYAPDGTVQPVTVIQAGPCPVVKVRTTEKDGYAAVQLGYGKTKRVKQSVAGELKELGPLSVLKEFRSRKKDDPEVANAKRGDVWKVDLFKAGDRVDVIGTSKGRGFAGVVKRHHFRGGPATHGQAHSTREPGSIASKRQGPVAKGQRMAGHMGADRVTVKQLTVVKIDPEKNLLFVLGAVPGARRSLVQVVST